MGFQVFRNSHLRIVLNLISEISSEVSWEGYHTLGGIGWGYYGLVIPLRVYLQLYTFVYIDFQEGLISREKLDHIRASGTNFG